MVSARSSLTWSLLIRGPQRARRQAETPLIVLCRFPGPALIDAERFVEFERSMSYHQSTRAFDKTIQEKLLDGQKPIVLTEGETDPKYLKTSAELLGFTDLLQQSDFDWVGFPSTSGAVGGGKSHLNDAFKFLKNNPQFQTRRTVLLYDSDANKPNEDSGNIFIRSLPRNHMNSRRKSGIENLLPEEVFEDRFYHTKIIEGDDGGSRRVLDKSALCDYLCDKVRSAAHFANFRDPLEELSKLLVAVTAISSSAQQPQPV